MENQWDRGGATAKRPAQKGNKISGVICVEAEVKKKYWGACNSSS